MERQITISQETQTLLNAIFDLENLTDSAYSTIRSYLSDDAVSDPTGQDLLDASLALRDRLEYYLKDRYNTAIMETSNSGPRVVL